MLCDHPACHAGCLLYYQSLDPYWTAFAGGGHAFFCTCADFIALYYVRACCIFFLLWPYQGRVIHPQNSSFVIVGILLRNFFLIVVRAALRPFFGGHLCPLWWRIVSISTTYLFIEENHYKYKIKNGGNEHLLKFKLKNPQHAHKHAHHTH